MDKIFSVLFCLSLIGFGVSYGVNEFSGAVYADSITSNIVCDGAIWASSSVVGKTQTYVATLFTSDLAVLMRNLDVGADVKAVTSLNSTGSYGVNEFSGQTSNQTQDLKNCVFIPVENNTIRMDKIGYTGLMQRGTYDSTRVINRETSSKTMVNGTGMMLSRAESRDENKTETHSSDAAGNMSMIELITFGGGE